MTKFLPIWLGLLLCMPLLHADTQSDNPYEMETLINDRLRSFPFHNENLFRLAAYAEMTGQYSSKFHALTLPFGNLGTLSIYERNCLFRTPKGVFHLDVGQSSCAQIKAMNDQLAYTFDQIILLGNHAAEDELVNFVDRHLAKKNIEPFIIAFDGQTDPDLVKGHQHFWGRLGAAGKIIKTLKSHNIQDLVLIGSLDRPTVFDLKPDLKTAAFFTRVGLKAMGDNALLECVEDELKREGFHIHAIQDFVDDLLAPVVITSGEMSAGLSLRLFALCFGVPLVRIGVGVNYLGRGGVGLMNLIRDVADHLGQHRGRVTLCNSALPSGGVVRVRGSHDDPT